MRPSSQGRRSGRGALAFAVDLLTTAVGVAVLLVGFTTLMRSRRSDGNKLPRSEDVESALLGHIPGNVAFLRSGSSTPDTVRFEGSSPHLVFLYRSDCFACQRVKHVWEELLEVIPSQVSVHAVTREHRGHAGFLSGVRVQEWHATSAAAVEAAFPSPIVPVTVAVSPAGVIGYARVGMLSAEDVDSLVRALERWALGGARSAGGHSQERP